MKIRRFTIRFVGKVDDTFPSIFIFRLLPRSKEIMRVSHLPQEKDCDTCFEVDTTVRAEPSDVWHHATAVARSYIHGLSCGVSYNGTFAAA